MNPIESKIIEGNKCFLCKSIQFACISGLMGYTVYDWKRKYKTMTTSLKFSYITGFSLLTSLLYVNYNIAKDIYLSDKFVQETFWQFYKRQFNFKISSTNNQRAMLEQWNILRDQQLSHKNV